MKLTDMHVFDKARVVAKTLGIQVCLFVGLLVLVWGSQAFYGVIDTTKNSPRPTLWARRRT